MKKEMICIVCPQGCHLEIDDQSLEVEGNKCKRGIAYAKKELLNPTRMLTSTVKVNSKHQRRVSVKTTDAIPKDRIFETMALLENIDLKVPVKIGTKVIENIFDTGVDIVATWSLND